MNSTKALGSGSTPGETFPASLGSPAGHGRGNVVLLRPERMAGIVQPAPDRQTIHLVVALRLLLQQSLLKPRQDWDKACMLIAAAPDSPLQCYAAAFFQGIEILGTRRFQFFVPQSLEVSNDEMWLVQLITQLKAANIQNARILVALRVQQRGRRRLLFLADGLTRGLNQELIRTAV